MRAFALAALIAATGATPAPSSATTTTVHIKNFAYAPVKLTVAAGTTVRFVNDDDEAHTVTAVGKGFDSGGLDTGDAFVHRFSTAGTYAYFCALHPYMKGTIVVTAVGGSK
jgi:plastocyanin